ncbi:hypothetical protein BDM02DRAFT_3116302 [Thelephora ganbajun]|uniref:Uncharacterized protein n=1 Tax=Thelephora ganbajun TaxID=370292 RepID=A0ACB6ZEY8_THEGA|nr:hypothetical protein BDM02DRAFT_3116302 [Thelephora ganbajun]
MVSSPKPTSWSLEHLLLGSSKYVYLGNEPEPWRCEIVMHPQLHSSSFGICGRPVRLFEGSAYSPHSSCSSMSRVRRRQIPLGSPRSPAVPYPAVAARRFYLERM